MGVLKLISPPRLDIKGETPTGCLGRMNARTHASANPAELGGHLREDRGKSICLVGMAVCVRGGFTAGKCAA